MGTGTLPYIRALWLRLREITPLHGMSAIILAVQLVAVGGIAQVLYPRVTSALVISAHRVHPVTIWGSTNARFVPIFAELRIVVTLSL